ECFFREGQHDQAIATAQRVLAFAPENHHALSNLVRYHFLMGRTAEVPAWLDRLKAVPATEGDVWVKKPEALSYLGDDQGVLEVVRGREQAGGEQAPYLEAFLYHLAAVAAYRLGQEDEARGYWKQALKQVRGVGPAQANPDDLDRPVAGRHAPWAFGFSNWVTEKTMRDIDDFVRTVSRKGENQPAQPVTQSFLRTHPALVHLLPILFDRGDPVGREFALRFALAAQAPEVLSILKDFALSQRGPDQMRMQAGQTAYQAGLFPPGPVRLWIEGEWKDILMMGFEISFEPTRVHSKVVENLAADASEALNQGDANRGEELLKKALELEPDAPDLLNNLAVAYQLQGQVDRGEEMIRDLHQRYPDYFFGRVSVARLAIREKDLDKARTLLDPLLRQKRMHITEFVGLAQAEIEYHVAQGQWEGARGWLKMWEDVDPDHPGLPQWRRRLQPGLWDRLTKWGGH